MKLTKLAFAMTIALTGCTSQTEHLKSLNPEYFDKDTPVGEDFYHHVNRGWQKAHPLTDRRVCPLRQLQHSRRHSRGARA